MERLAAGAVIVQPVVRFTSRHGLDGQHHQLRTRDGDMHLFLLADDHFLYSVRADVDGDAGRALAESIEPVPRLQRPDADAFEFWTE